MLSQLVMQAADRYLTGVLSDAAAHVASEPIPDVLADVQKGASRALNQACSLQGESRNRAKRGSGLGYAPGRVCTRASEAGADEFPTPRGFCMQAAAWQS